MENWRQYIVPQTYSIRQALQLLDKIGIVSGVLFAIDADGKLVGSITDGDIRRGLLRDLSISDPVTVIIHKNCKKVTWGSINTAEIKEYLKSGIKHVPVVDIDGGVIDILDLGKYKAILPLDVVFMAGGKGERLLPLTEKTPKPLLQVGEKPILEHNVDRVAAYGIRNVFVSINYLGDMIRDHFGDGSGRQLNIQYLTEERPLGTIGVLGGVDRFEHRDVLVMNSDLLTNIDFEDFYDKFKQSGADMAVATVPYHVDLPYAILEVEDKTVVSLKEKPRYTYFANAGIYIMRIEVLKMIPAGKYYNATDLMDKVVELKLKLIQYPILSYWLDIGGMAEFTKAQEDIKTVKF